MGRLQCPLLAVLGEDDQNRPSYESAMDVSVKCCLYVLHKLSFITGHNNGGDGAEYFRWVLPRMDTGTKTLEEILNAVEVSQPSSAVSVLGWASWWPRHPDDSTNERSRSMFFSHHSWFRRVMWLLALSAGLNLFLDWKGTLHRASVVKLLFLPDERHDEAIREQPPADHPQVSKNWSPDRTTVLTTYPCQHLQRRVNRYKVCTHLRGDWGRNRNHFHLVF